MAPNTTLQIKNFSLAHKIYRLPSLCRCDYCQLELCCTAGPYSGIVCPCVLASISVSFTRRPLYVLPMHAASHAG